MYTKQVNKLLLFCIPNKLQPKENLGLFWWLLLKRAKNNDNENFHIVYNKPITSYSNIL